MKSVKIIQATSEKAQSNANLKWDCKHACHITTAPSLVVAAGYMDKGLKGLVK